MQRYGRQSEYSRRAYEWMDESRPNRAGWKAAALLYSTLHGANHWFAAQKGKVPENRAGRNRRAGREPPRIFDDYRDLRAEHACTVPRRVQNPRLLPRACPGPAGPAGEGPSAPIVRLQVSNSICAWATHAGAGHGEAVAGLNVHRPWAAPRPPTRGPRRCPPPPARRRAAPRCSGTAVCARRRACTAT